MKCNIELFFCAEPKSSCMKRDYNAEKHSCLIGKNVAFKFCGCTYVFDLMFIQLYIISNYNYVLQIEQIEF